MNLWDLKAPVYDVSRKIFPVNLILKQEIKEIKRLLSQVPSSPYPTLDVGAGSGFALNLLMRPSGVIHVAVDSSKIMLRKISKKQTIHKVMADGRHLPFPANTFVLVTAIGIVEYIKDVHEFLKELKRVLLESGYLLITISPPCFLNFCRIFYGHTLYFWNFNTLNKIMESLGFHLMARGKSLIQEQLLFALNSTDEL